MLSFETFREQCRQDLSRADADEATLRRFYYSRWTARETVAFLRRSLGRTHVSPQKARALVSSLGWSKVKQGFEWPSLDGSSWVGSAGSYYYTRPNGLAS